MLLVKSIAQEVVPYHRWLIRSRHDEPTGIPDTQDLKGDI